jgi:hypothetical protein
MRFLTLSEQQIKTPTIYNQIKEKHIVISISGSDDKETIVPNNPNRMGLLRLKFDDVEDIQEQYVYYDRGLAAETLDFVERYCTQVSLIVVQCKAGLSRSVGLASALSKIINGKDDDVFTKGIPNMFVYITTLEYVFANPDWQSVYYKISTIRNKQLLQFLSPAMIRLSAAKSKKRL